MQPELLLPPPVDDDDEPPLDEGATGDVDVAVPPHAPSSRANVSGANLTRHLVFMPLQYCITAASPPGIAATP